MENAICTQIGIIALAGFLIYLYGYRKTTMLPPGPKALPFIGNLLDLPGKGTPEYKHWLKHKDIYGSISSITIMGDTFVFIHDEKIATDLLNERSAQCSNRPRMVFGGTMCGYNNLMHFKQYNRHFQSCREFLYNQLESTDTASQLETVCEMHIERLLLRILNHPEQLHNNLKSFAGGVILKVAYGYSVGFKNMDPLVNLIQRMVANLFVATTPKSFIVDVIPALKYLPSGIPGTGFKDIARQWRTVLEAATNVPYDSVRRQMASGSYQPSFVSNLVQKHGQKNKQQLELSAEDESNIKWTATSLYSAGTSTTTITLQSFILAMILFPSIQLKAQQEIDHVLDNKVPEGKDRKRLPYIDSLTKEVFRWFPAAPLGITHVTSAEMEYNGYIIPKGAHLTPSIWWFLHNPEDYRDPDSFNPDRFLNPHNEPDPRDLVFGFGHRICPGRYFADSVIFLTIARILASFKISAQVDENGMEIPVQMKPQPGLLCSLQQFSYTIIPRSKHYTQQIRRFEAKLSGEEGDAQYLHGLPDITI